MLRPYQHAGIEWLRSRERAALLADQPGLGKTVQILRSHSPDHGLVIVCPKSAKAVWAREIAKWEIPLGVEVLSGGQSWRWPAAGSAVILNYANLPWLPCQVARAGNGRPGPVNGTPIAPTHVVFDECQALRKRKSLQHLRARALAKKCVRVTGATGTPVGGSPFDLYGMLLALGACPWGWFDFLARFNAFALPHGGHDFRRDARGHIIVDPRVAAELAPIMLRRLRVDVAAELPPKIYREVEITHTRATHVELDRVGVECAKWLDADELPPFTEFAAVRKLIAEERIPYLRDALDAREDRGEIGIVLSAHRAPVIAAGARPGWGAIHGGTPEIERVRLIDAFEAGGLRGIAIVLRTAATAISLPSADYVLFVDRSWDPDENEQAEDRANRLSRTKGPIQVEIWTSKHPIAKHLTRILARKRALVSAVLKE